MKTKSVLPTVSPFSLVQVDSDGVLYCKLPKSRVTLEDLDESYFSLKMLSRIKKPFYVLDGREMQKMDSQTLEYIFREFPKLCSAIAITVPNLRTKLWTMLFIRKVKRSIPIRMFTRKEEAKTWFNSYAA